MKKSLLVFSLIAASAIWNGCSTTSPTKPENDNPVKFVWLDSGTVPSVTFTGAQLSKSVDGRPRVTAHLHNKELFRIEVQANCVFQDAQGFTVDESPYRTLILDESATEDVMFESFTTNAVQYLVRVRKAR